MSTAVAEEYQLTAALGSESTGAFRGVKSERLNPSVYGYVEFEHGEMLAGVFANPVSIAGETNLLTLGYFSWRPRALGVRWEVGGRYYAFPDSSIFTYDLDGDGFVDHSGDKGLFEATAGADWWNDDVRVRLLGFWTPDNFAETGDAGYLYGEGRIHLGDGLEARGAAGYSAYADRRFNDNYIDYNVGVYKSLFGLDMFVRYSDTAGLVGADNRVVVFGVEKAWSVLSSSGREAHRFDKIRNRWLIDKSLLTSVH
jgi:uncharacterized protein (TIGR02001 family)